MKGINLTLYFVLGVASTILVSASNDNGEAAAARDSSIRSADARGAKANKVPTELPTDLPTRENEFPTGSPSYYPTYFPTHTPSTYIPTTSMPTIAEEAIADKDEDIDDEDDADVKELAFMNNDEDIDDNDDADVKELVFMENQRPSWGEECTVIGTGKQAAKFACRGRNVFCVLDRGNCTGKGKCRLPIGASLNKTPVCGCDGKTYKSANRAFRNAINIKKDGTCSQVGEECTVERGGMRANRVCNVQGEYCQLRSGQCFGTGTCQKQTKRFRFSTKTQVCGCDSWKYGSKNGAQRYGVNVWINTQNGICPPRKTPGKKGATCVVGGRNELDPRAVCGGSFYCRLEKGQCPNKTGVAAVGKCARYGEAKIGFESPQVCTCAGQTTTERLARRNGQNIHKNRACRN